MITPFLAAAIAYGFIDSDGSITTGTPNFTCTYNATSVFYEITIDNESYFFNQYVTIVTPIEPNQSIRTSSSNGRLLILLEDSATGDNESGRFQFVTYKPTGSAELLGRNRPAPKPLAPNTPLDDELIAPNRPAPRTPVIQEDPKNLSTRHN